MLWYFYHASSQPAPRCPLIVRLIGLWFARFITAASTVLSCLIQSSQIPCSGQTCQVLNKLLMSSWDPSLGWQHGGYCHFPSRWKLSFSLTTWQTGQVSRKKLRLKVWFSLYLQLETTILFSFCCGQHIYKQMSPWAQQKEHRCHKRTRFCWKPCSFFLSVMWIQHIWLSHR